MAHTFTGGVHAEIVSILDGFNGKSLPVGYIAQGIMRTKEETMPFLERLQEKNILRIEGDKVVPVKNPAL